jgi:DNA-binding response OmpR family regulator
MTLLLIDDDRDDMDFFAIASTEMEQPFDMISFSDCDEALLHLKTINLRPDYIFVDLVLPHMDGKKCLQSIRAEDSLRTVPVIMFVVANLSIDDIELIKQGANLLAQKPSSIQDIKIMLSDIFSRWPVQENTFNHKS